MTDRTVKPLDEGTTTITGVPQGEPLFSELATQVAIVDEAGGEFLEVSQSGGNTGMIQIEPREWPSLRAVIDRMIGWCRNDK